MFYRIFILIALTSTICFADNKVNSLSLVKVSVNPNDYIGQTVSLYGYLLKEDNKRKDYVWLSLYKEDIDFGSAFILDCSIDSCFKKVTGGRFYKLTGQVNFSQEEGAYVFKCSELYLVENGTLIEVI